MLALFDSFYVFLWGGEHLKKKTARAIPWILNGEFLSGQLLILRMRMRMRTTTAPMTMTTKTTTKDVKQNKNVLVYVLISLNLESLSSLLYVGFKKKNIVDLSWFGF